MASSEEPKPPLLSALARGNNMITVNVGTEHEKYSVYAELISYYSGYFKRILNGPWKEAKDRIIELPDIEPRVFDIFIDWMYTQKLPKKTRDWNAPTAELAARTHGHGQQAERLIMESYVFADRFIVPQFRVAIYKCYANFCNSGGNPPYYDAIIYAFDNLPPTSAMLTLLVRTHCAYWHEDSDNAENGELELRQELPQDFFLRAMSESSKMRDKSKAKEVADCECHKAAATTEREGCDTCMPLPEVNKEEAPADGDAQADAAPADGNAQANQTNVVPANNDGSTNQTAVQAGQGDGGNQAAQADNQAGQANTVADQAVGQTAHGNRDDQGDPNDEQADANADAESVSMMGIIIAAGML